MALDRLQEVTDALAEAIGRPVAVNDYALDLIAASAQTIPVDRYRVDSIMRRHTPHEVISLLGRRGLLRRTEPFIVESEALPGLQARMCVPISDNGFPIAYIWIVLGQDELSAADLQAVTHASAAILAELGKRQTPGSDGLLSDSQRLQRALDADEFSSRYAITALVADGVLSAQDAASVTVFSFAAADGSRPADLQQAFRPVRDRAARSWARAALIGTAEGRLVMLCAPERAAQLVELAHREIPAALPDGVALRGSGTSATRQATRGLRDVFDEARYAARVARGGSATQRALQYQELGAYLALRHLPEDEASVQLLSPDAAELRRQSTHTYAGTVLAYLNNAGNVPATCAALSIHRTTLYYRLDRAREIIGDAIDVGWRRTSLHLALLLGELVDDANRRR